MDFIYLHKECPNDKFPIFNIDMLVAATAGHESFVYGWFKWLYKSGFIEMT